MPTILNYRQAEQWQQLNLKSIYASYYYISKIERQKKQVLDISSHSENERLMFIFANTFELICSFKQFKTQDVYPMLQTLKMTVVCLPRSLFDTERSYVDEYVLTLILRNQLQSLMEYKTTQSIFGQIFGETLDRKMSIFDDKFNPQAAICITSVYSSVLVATKS